jgi:hypothetical protein
MEKAGNNGKEMFFMISCFSFFCPKQFPYKFWIIPLLPLLFLSSSLDASRVVVGVLEGDFEQEYRIVEQGGIWRIDAPHKDWSIIYHSASGRYTGMDHRDAVYWGFRWEDVQKSLQGSKHHFRRFGDLNIEGFASYDLTRPSDQSSSKVEFQIEEFKGGGEWQGLPSRSWKLTRGGQNDLRVRTVSHPFLHHFFEQFLTIHDQIRQAVIRPLWPEWLDEASRGLRKENSLPVEIQWGSGANPSYWKIIRFEEKTEEPPSFFVPSKKYRPTTVESLRGILDDSEGKK